MLTSKLEKFYFIIAFILLSVIVVFTLEKESKQRTDSELTAKTEQINHDYQMFFNSYEKLSHLIFDTKINKEDVLRLFKERKRQELLEFLKSDYALIRSYNIAQLHFHTDKNLSFLRMHRPKKFGDDLTDIRATVKYTNENKDMIKGFEEGRIFNGFRFVYPLFYEKKHIGSVEISFSGLFFINEIIKNYGVAANLLINKKVVDQKVFDSEQFNYVKSSLPNFYFQKSILEKLKENYSNYKINEFEDKQIETIENKISKGNPFSIYIQKNEKIITFIPLINPIHKQVVASLLVESKNQTISKHLFHVFIIKIILIALIGLIMLFLYKIYFFQRNLKMQIKEKTKELNDLNKNLKKIVEEEISKNKEKDELMIVQSRHAAMGEMISMIAHQWRQPIAVISMAVNNILIDLELGGVNEEELKDLANDILEQTNHLSKTIDDFRDFFKPEKKKELTDVNKVIDESLSIIGKSLENNNVNLVKELNSKIELNTYSRELLQVVLNILKNAKEALSENQTSNKTIKIKTYDDNNTVIIEICDNGGGIDEKIKENIFQPYFSTKKEKMGTGIGLYMSKTIIEKHIHGIINFTNTDEGVCFTIKIPRLTD